MSLNNIHVQHSSIGILNAGHIEAVDGAVGVMNTGGDQSAGEAFKAFTEQLIALAVDTQVKGQLLELLSVLATEGTAPRDHRRRSAMRPVLAELGSICGGVAALAELYARFQPAITALFQ